MNSLLRALLGVVDIGAYQTAEGDPVLSYTPSTHTLDVHADALTLDGAPVASAQAFEATDLVIAAGTDYSDGHILGSFVIASPAYLLALELEVNAIVAPDELQLYVWGPEESASATYTSYGGAHVDQAQKHRASLTLELASTNLSRTSTDGTNGYGYTANGSLISGSLHAGLWTSGPTTAEIELVRARAAFVLV